MSKKRTGLLIALGAMIGAAAAGIAYYLQYKSFNDELDKDFHDYEEEDGPVKRGRMSRFPARRPPDAIISLWTLPNAGLRKNRCPLRIQKKLLSPLALPQGKKPFCTQPMSWKRKLPARPMQKKQKLSRLLTTRRKQSGLLQT